MHIEFFRFTFFFFSMISYQTKRITNELFIFCNEQFFTCFMAWYERLLEQKPPLSLMNL
ncbi:hypothetical protein Lalb_Chr07g0193251 [Lupinus albus]|uniref:Uncharacterized protein n=1 Tax=Lupinus albus TaxID=3870 RepID=A0A6A4Q9X9_LUPAL|nr:hypothetical protein Lalb_Chr07g0193251 [Lupinus albus]